jgi:hypothetical protein
VALDAEEGKEFFLSRNTCSSRLKKIGNEDEDYIEK